MAAPLEQLFADGLAFVLHPNAEDIVRLDNEFRSLARGFGGGAAVGLFDSVRRSPVAEGPLELNVLAGTTVRSGCEVALSDGEFAILTAFAMNRSAVSRLEWCDVLWPDRDCESAERLLRVYVHRIRNKFGCNRIIETFGGGYRIGPEVRIDVHAIEALARTCATGAVRLEPATVTVLERSFKAITERRYCRAADLEMYPELERRFVALAAELARLLVGQAVFERDIDRALRVAQRLAELDPCDDVAVELLIRTQLDAGRSDAAARDFRTHCRTLRDELDLPPPQHLVRLLAAGRDDGR
jgi:DNA-binding SARP family transcriptional activator